MTHVAHTAPDRSVLARPSGAFAMLALDQREALRTMLAAHQESPVPDAQVTEFKLTATRVLSPRASAVLIDKQFALDAAVEAAVVARDCALIAAADRFIPSADELVADSDIDEQVVPAAVKAQGAAAMKLLIIYRPDGAPERRIAMVERFVEQCRHAGLLSIIEPVSRVPDHGGPWDWNQGVLAAARELGNRGADLYKAEVPLHGLGSSAEMQRGCAAITEAVACPWVVLSSGVPADVFPTAVEIACQEGASGFLAGRAVWQPSIGQPNLEQALQEDALPRLRYLHEVADAAVTS